MFYDCNKISALKIAGMLNYVFSVYIKIQDR